LTIRDSTCSLDNRQFFSRTTLVFTNCKTLKEHSWAWLRGCFWRDTTFNFNEYIFSLYIRWFNFFLFCSDYVTCKYISTNLTSFEINNYISLQWPSYMARTWDHRKSKLFNPKLLLLPPTIWLASFVFCYQIIWKMNIFTLTIIQSYLISIILNFKHHSIIFFFLKL
jgi:hypothetical protein